ncbi:hypothetical protein [Calothrix sp. NIES-3974]|uniref:hypothetical protein n=1 Tax=Calothrix sp. NIES-3974 TaxID=2005462 RepID=UPI000B61CA0E|nr:hypothetical protein [Calothrix sp. NIES-3974]BAZ06300.1 hypothetical protein NIES3974_29580 [Calothrix sp. NIES-3974]
MNEYTLNGKHGPIEVFEDNTHFLVRIHPQDRNRAKKIVGRQWDGNRTAWVYPKNFATYEALVVEFQRDADHFNIQRPRTEPPVGINTPVNEPDNGEFDSQFLEEIPFNGVIGGNRGNIFSELEQIRVMIESLRDTSAKQNLILEELRVNQEATSNTLTKFKQPIQQIVKTEADEVFPKFLNLDEPKEKELLEKALIELACLTVGKEERLFRQWVSKHHPLSRPADFVNETHEFLKKHLSKFLKDEDDRVDFIELIKRAKDENVFFSDNSDPTIKPINILYILNHIRNRFAHPPFNFTQSDKWSRAILYLMNLALVWSKVVMEAEEEDEIPF